MKLGWVTIFILLIASVNGGSGRTFDLDFNLHDEYSIWLDKSDRVLFECGGYNHTIIIDEIKNKTVELDVFLFLEKELHTPYYIYLNKKHDLRLDFDKDGVKEMSIVLKSIESDEQKVNLFFKKLEAWDSEARIEFEEGKFEKTRYIWILGGGIMGGIFLFLIGYFFKEKGMYF